LKKSIIFRTKNLTPDLVNEWYEKRARRIEKLSHLTEEALHLIDLGNERGAEGLSQLQFDLKTLDNLLFECGSDLALNLDDLLRKTPLERIRLMMAQVQLRIKTTAFCATFQFVYFI